MKKKIIQGNFLITILLLILVIIQGANLYFSVRPPSTPVIQGLTEQQKETLEKNKALLEKVRKLTVIPDDEKAIIATITDAEGLRSANPIQEEVYKDAQTGQKVIGLSDKMIIYDDQANRIIYEGKSPAQIQEEQYLEELEPIMASLSELIDINPNARPELRTITDPNKAKEAMPELYKDAKIGDKLLIFTDRILIYRPTTDQIIFDGKINVNQTQQQPQAQIQPLPTNRSDDEDED